MTGEEVEVKPPQGCGETDLMPPCEPDSTGLLNQGEHGAQPDAENTLSEYKLPGLSRLLW